MIIVRQRVVKIPGFLGLGQFFQIGGRQYERRFQGDLFIGNRRHFELAQEAALLGRGNVLKNVKDALIGNARIGLINGYFDRYRAGLTVDVHLRIALVPYPLTIDGQFVQFGANLLDAGLELAVEHSAFFGDFVFIL